MAEDLIVELNDCEVATEYEFIIERHDHTEVLKAIVVDVQDTDSPFAVHLISREEEPFHFAVEEVRKVRIVCPGCRSTHFERGYEVDEDRPGEVEVPYVRCADCFWSPMEAGDEVYRFIPSER